MKKLIILLFSAFIFTGISAQQQNPVTWQTTYKSLSSTEGEIIITATIEKGWHTYSQRPTEAGPISTTFTFPPSKQYTLVGKTEESGAHEEYEKAFEAKVFSFSDKAEFKQKIKLTGKAGFPVAFKVEIVCCNDKMCLPPKTTDLTVKVE